MKRNIQLLVIDPQNDFCDLPESYLHASPFGLPGTDTVVRPQLPVPGAHADMLRVAELINKGFRGLEDISVTLDSHQRVGIERPAMWMQADGSPVAPFTTIRALDVRAGRFLPRNPATMSRVLAYLDQLEAAGRYLLMVWTPHCEIGTWGHNVHLDVRTAYNRWEESNVAVVNKVTKGSNPYTEHYSALMAEVPDANDPSTQLNRGFIDILTQADLLLVGGEAGSHCVKATIEHLADNFGAGSLSKIVLLTDCMSPVTGFESNYKDFLSVMRGRGLQTATAAEILPELISNSRR